MQQLIILICKDEFFVFDGVEPVFIEGNDSFSYSLNRVQEDLAYLFERLSRQYNLSSSAEISISIVTNEDNFITETIKEAFRNQEKAVSIDNEYKIIHCIESYIKQLSNDKTLHIDEFGVNFDGVNYTIKNNSIEKQPFSLLSHAVRVPDLANYIEN